MRSPYETTVSIERGGHLPEGRESADELGELSELAIEKRRERRARPLRHDRSRFSGQISSEPVQKPGGFFPVPRNGRFRDPQQAIRRLAHRGDHGPAGGA